MNVLYLALSDNRNVFEDMKKMAEQNLLIKYLNDSEDFFKKFLHKTAQTCPDIDLKNYKDLIVQASGNRDDRSTGYKTVLNMILDRICIIEETQGNLEEITGKSEILECCKQIYYAVNEVRQLCWLSILEDYYCEKIENAYTRMQNQLGSDNWLVIAVLPEFALSKDCSLSRDPTVSVAVAQNFFNDTLPDKLRDDNHMRRFAQLSGKFNTPGHKHNMVIFAGSLRVRELRAAGDGTVVSNIVPVFCNGVLCHVWEKQMISNEDGIRLEERHTVLFDDKNNGERIIIENEDPQEQFYAGAFTKSILQQFQLGNIMPTFSLNLFGRTTVSFAVSVCLDYMSKDIIDGQTTDIHLLMSAGMYMSSYMENIVALKLFVYCDGFYSPGLVAAYKNFDQNLDYWKEWDEEQLYAAILSNYDVVQNRIFAQELVIADTVP